jgi:hypothetical protein
MSMTLVSTVTVGSGGAASIDFGSIAATGTDLLLVVSARSSNSSVSRTMNLRVNGSSISYGDKSLIGSGSAASSAGDAGGGTQIYTGEIPAATSTSSTFANISIYIPNYAGSTNKSFSIDNVNENNATASQTTMGAGRWSDTAAITSISLTQPSANFVQHSTASLYLITKGSGGATTSP